MRHTAINIMLIAVSVLALVGSCVTGYLLTQSEDSEILTLTVKDGMHETVEFENFCIAPGEESLYEVLLRPALASSYTLTMRFELCGEDTLAPFLFAEIELDGERIALPLTELLAGKAVSRTVKVDGERAVPLRLRYYIPAEVGNEAQATALDFLLEITASSEVSEHE